MTLAQSERAALADLLEQLGPEEPTRCAGWNTGDLLDHLLVRERRPDAAAGIMLPFLKAWNARVSAVYDAKPFAQRLSLLRSGPPALHPARIPAVDRLTNDAEFFIHHEDVRRGRPGWQPRDVDAETTASLMALVKSPAVRFGVRRAGVGVVARLSDGQEVTLHGGEPVVTVAGAPGEIVIWSSSRPAARVTLTGDPDAVATLERAGLGVDPSL